MHSKQYGQINGQIVRGMNDYISTYHHEVHLLSSHRCPLNPYQHRQFKLPEPSVHTPLIQVSILQELSKIITIICWSMPLLFAYITDQVILEMRHI